MQPLLGQCPVACFVDIPSRAPYAAEDPTYTRASHGEGAVMTDPVRRVHYFAGQALTPEDLQADQDYHRAMRYRHNQLLGQGVVHGLDVTVSDGTTVTVGAGLAIDGWGRELVVSDDVRVDLGDAADSDGSQDLIVTWAEEPDSFVPPVDECADDQAFTRWVERPRLSLVPPGGAPTEAIVLGRLMFTDGVVTGVDDSGRSTWQSGAPDPTARPGSAPEPG